MERILFPNWFPLHCTSLEIRVRPCEFIFKLSDLYFEIFYIVYNLIFFCRITEKYYWKYVFCFLLCFFILMMDENCIFQLFNQWLQFIILVINARQKAKVALLCLSSIPYLDLPHIRITNWSLFCNSFLLEFSFFFWQFYTTAVLKNAKFKIFPVVVYTALLICIFVKLTPYTVINCAKWFVNQFTVLPKNELILVADSALNTDIQK